MLAYAFSIALWGFMASQAHAEACRYSIDPASVTVGYTAYKTTEKVGAEGSFSKVAVKFPRKDSDTLEKLLKGVEGKVDPTKLQTGNPGRDLNIVEGFFKVMPKPIVLTARIVDYRGDKLTLSVGMGGTRKIVPMTATYSPETGAFHAKGTLSVLDFGLKAALESLNARCLDVHKGADGVSKTWPDVDVKLSAQVTRACR